MAEREKQHPQLGSMLYYVAPLCFLWRTGSGGPHWLGGLGWYAAVTSYPSPSFVSPLVPWSFSLQDGVRSHKPLRPSHPVSPTQFCFVAARFFSCFCCMKLYRRSRRCFPAAHSSAYLTNDHFAISVLHWQRWARQPLRRCTTTCYQSLAMQHFLAYLVRGRCAGHRT